MAVAIAIVGIIDGAVAVVIHAVAYLGGSGVDQVVVVVTVAAAGGNAVTVLVELLIDLAIAVIVDGVALL